MNGLVQGHLNPTPAVVAIPAHNEADWIPRCLTALNTQQDQTPFRVVLLVNDSTDGTASVARSIQPALTYSLDIIEHQFPPELRNAGQARRMALEHAARWVLSEGVLLCTDADGQVAPDWLAANLCQIRNGADAVAGRAVIDPVDAAAIPAILHEDDARECAYAALLDEIDCLLDPDPADPWPRHNENSGASICVTAKAYHRSGGMPPLSVGEDRAFFDALRRIDARLRHAPDVWVTVSGRIHGRAAGGMADTIRRRLAAPDLFLDDALEPAMARVRRARLRRQIRRSFNGHGRVKPRLFDDLGCAPAVLAIALQRDTFGAAWEMVEAHAAALNRVPVPVSALPHETAQAERILAALRSDQLAIYDDWPDRAGLRASLMTAECDQGFAGPAQARSAWCAASVKTASGAGCRR